MCRRTPTAQSISVARGLAVMSVLLQTNFFLRSIAFVIGNFFTQGSSLHECFVRKDPERGGDKVVVPYGISFPEARPVN